MNPESLGSTRVFIVDKDVAEKNTLLQVFPSSRNTPLQIPYDESVSGQDKNHGLDSGEEGGGNRAG